MQNDAGRKTDVHAVLHGGGICFVIVRFGICRGGCILMHFMGRTRENFCKRGLQCFSQRNLS